jgi:hypothetical protein
MNSKNLLKSLEEVNWNFKENLAEISTSDDLKISLKSLKSISLLLRNKSDVEFSLLQLLLSHLHYLSSQFCKLLILGNSKESNQIHDLIIQIAHIIGECSEKRMVKQKDNHLIALREIDHLHSQYLQLVDIGKLIPKIGFACIEPIGYLVILVH